MKNSDTDIEERIFSCINRFNFKLVATAIAEWELEHPAPDAQKLRLQSINLLHECYHSIEHAEDDETEFSCKSGGLVAICYIDDVGFLQFQLEFILQSVSSSDE